MKQVITRRDAHAQALTRFYTGVPCVHGHYSERYTVNGACIACQNWKSPKRQRPGPRGNNVGWPTQGLVFDVAFTPTPREIEAAFRYIEASGWHSEALRRVHADPELLAKHVLPPSQEERIRLVHLKAQIRDEMAGIKPQEIKPAAPVDEYYTQTTEMCRNRNVKGFDGDDFCGRPKGHSGSCISRYAS